MRNGTQSSNLRLIDDAARSSDASEHHTGAESENRSTGVSPILILFTVSLACATAAIASGSYALWLTRQKAARKTLTDVQDILKICRLRMQQLEDDLSNLPVGFNIVSA